MAAPEAQNAFTSGSGQLSPSPVRQAHSTFENIYGLNIPTPSMNSTSSIFANSLAAVRRNLETNYDWPLPRTDSNRRTNEAQAVRRQRQLHRDWERVQRQNQERAARQARLDIEQAEQQAQDESTRRVRRRISQTPETSEDESGVDSVSTSAESSPKKEPIDLTHIEDDKTLTDLVAKEQQALIASQRQSSPTNAVKNPLAEYKCAICMDMPTDVTTTTCGHMFCHQCIIDSLRWSERQLAETQRPPRNKGLCPVCRSHLDTKDVANSKNLVVMNIKKMNRAEYEKLKREKAKGKARAEAEDHAGTSGAEHSHREPVHDTDRARRKRKRAAVKEEEGWEKFLNKDEFV